jgi:hypothetical protein
MQNSQTLISNRPGIISRIPRPGRGAAPQGGGVHGYDDKRDQHLDELRRRFATRVLKRIQKLRKSEGAGTVILAASARMRRFLYPEMEDQARLGFRFHKVSKNMINFSPQKIHAYLAGEGLIPRQQNPQTYCKQRGNFTKDGPTLKMRCPLLK